MVCGGNTFARTICSICYEDLKPVVEDLQSISICGHVFHELCLQQWFEYCTNKKKKNCPVCKQTCSEVNVGRLYFQSVGDPNLSQKPISCEENPAELRGEIDKLEGKVSELRSTLEHYQKDVKELSDELCLSKEQVKKEAALKREALQQKTDIQKELYLKSKELITSKSECESMAQKLAASKLDYDLYLTEEEIRKFASLGNETNNNGRMDILNGSLVNRNNWFKGLMKKCKELEKREACSLRELEKAKEKIKILEARIKEAEIAVEVNDNKVLRALKASKKTTCEGDRLNDAAWNSNSSSFNKCFGYQLEKPAEEKKNLDQNRSMPTDLIHPGKIKKLKPSKDIGIAKTKDDGNTNASDKEMSSYFIIDDDASEVTTVMHTVSQPDLNTQINEDVPFKKNCFSRPEVASDTKSELHRPCNIGAVSGSRSGSKGDMISSYVALDEDTVLLLDDIKQVQSFINVEKETPCPVPISRPGDLCFSGGLIGPDGNTRHLGKWCKRVHVKESAISSVAMQGSSKSSGNLIAVGADGRGGKIKVLKALNQSLLDSGAASTSAKRCKYGAKASSLQSQGCLQMEHFFRSAGP